MDAALCTVTNRGRFVSNYADMLQPTAPLTYNTNNSMVS